MFTNIVAFSFTKLSGARNLNNFGSLWSSTCLKNCGSFIDIIYDLWEHCVCINVQVTFDANCLTN